MHFWRDICSVVFPPSVIVSKIIGKVYPVRRSGNAGSTNMLRTFGFRLGFATLLGDILKSVLATLLGLLLLGDAGARVAGPRRSSATTSRSSQLQRRQGRGEFRGVRRSSLSRSSPRSSFLRLRASRSPGSCPSIRCWAPWAACRGAGSSILPRLARGHHAYPRIFAGHRQAP